MSTNSRLRGTSIPSAPNDRSSVKEVCFASDGIQSKIKMRDGKMVFDQYIGMEESVEKEKESQYRAATLRPKSADDQTSQQKRELILTKQQKSPNKKPGEMLTNMAAAEFKKTAKYHSSDRTLLAILEDERQKFINLEGQYSTLLNEVQALQSNHLEDLRNSGRKYDADAKNLQRALVLKSEECNDAQKDLSHWQSKYSKDSSLWLNTNEKLEDHLHTIQRDIRDLEEKLKDKDATVQEFRNEKQVVVEKIVRREKEVVERASTRERELVLKFQAMEKDLKDRITKREGDLKKYIYLAREKESCLLAEKEERMKLEVSNLQLEHVASQRDEEVKQLKIVLQRKQLEVEEVIKLKNNLIDARRDLEALADREKTYLEEIRSYQYRDSKTAVRSEELTMALKKLTVELERVSAERAMSMQEAKILRENEGHLRREVDERGRNVEQVMENFHALQNKDKQTQQNMARLQNDLGDTQTFNSELRQKNSEYFAKLQEGFQTIQDVQKAQADADTISRREKEDQYERQQQLSLELQKRQMDVSELQRNFSDCRNQLETEVKSKNDLQHRNKDTLVGLQNKMVEVQNVLKETQIQVQELRGVENQLRQVIVERDGLVTQHSGKISELQTVLSREQYERENLKSKKKDELNMVQDKFINAKQTMESEITTLRNAVQQKSVQINMLNEEVNQLRVDSSENSNQRFKAAEEVNRLKLEFSDHARQFTGLQQQALQKDQENSILHLKLSSLSDQIKRMDEEISIHRQASGQKDNELNRLQGNVGELTKRLRSQVEMLIGTEIGKEYTPLLPGPHSPLNTGVGNIYNYAYSPTITRATPPSISAVVPPAYSTRQSPRKELEVELVTDRMTSPGPHSLLNSTVGNTYNYVYSPKMSRATSSSIPAVVPPAPPSRQNSQKDLVVDFLTDKMTTGLHISPSRKSSRASSRNDHVQISGVDY